MSKLQLTATLAIKPGRLDDFKAAAAACMEGVRTRDKGTLQYDWFFNADQSVCHVREAYESSEALMEHIGNLGGTLNELLDTCSISIQMYGELSRELVAATEGFPTDVFSPFQLL